jgi:hypothetical protein
MIRKLARTSPGKPANKRIFRTHALAASSHAALHGIALGMTDWRALPAGGRFFPGFRHVVGQRMIGRPLASP